MKGIKFLTVFFAFSILALSPFASADIPHLISLQGKLTNPDGNAITDAQTNLTFRIYNDASAGNVLWSESHYPAALDANGVFSVLLGSIKALNIPFNESYWLSVEVRAGAGPSEVLSPRQQMGSAGYALRSESPWNTTGNNIYTTSSGNVGVGTTTPSAKLDVNGGVQVRNSLYNSNDWLYLYGMNGNIQFMNPSDYTQGVHIFANSQSIQGYSAGGSYGTLGLNPNGGNVGIGTASPGNAKLNVSGNISISGAGNGIVFPDGSVQTSKGLTNLDKNVANGVAGLDANGFVDDARILKRDWLNGSDIYYAHDADVTLKFVFNPAIPTKTKTIILSYLPNSVLRIAFAMRQGFGSETAYGQIYRNGVAVGTLQSYGGGQYLEFIENIPGWQKGDTLELWAYSTKANGAGQVTVRNFRILNAVSTSTTLISTTP